MAQQVYDHILQRMLTNDLKPGDWVDRRAIAQELRTSLMPVAEAVQRLTAEGFLVTVARRGTQVRVPSREDIWGQVLVREALECQAARLYCGKPLTRAGKGLKALAEKADRPEESASPWDADLGFHRALVELAGCPALLDNFNRVMNLALFQHTALFTPFPYNRGDSHVGLLADLIRAAPEAADARIRRHIRTGKEHLFDTVPSKRG
jgi:DNA-binding GntR family transcriptional regulator